MSQFKRFEDVPVWKLGRDFVKKVYAVTRTAPMCKDFGFCDQIQRAVISITSNIAEGHERGTTPDLIQFLYYSKGSCGEVRSLLYNAEDLGYATPAQAEEMRETARNISRQIYGWITSMQTPGFRGGPKFHKEPDRAYERFLDKTGMVRLPDGRIARRNAAETGDTTQPGERGAKT